MAAQDYSIEHVRSQDDLDAVHSLLTAYFNWLNLNLSFQGATAELTNLPGGYSRPTGELLLARDLDDRPLGCIALRALPQAAGRCCEIKRLYTVPAARGLGLGRALIKEILAVAVSKGYEECKLDTLPRMKAAIALYESLGFERVDAYYETPLEDTVFLRRILRETASV